MKATESVSIKLQGPSKVLHTVNDNMAYQKHRQRVATIDANVSKMMDTFDASHMVCKSHLGPQYMESQRAGDIEKKNKNLFDKIENIIKRQGPYKLQPSQKNPKKLAKVFHVPSDHNVQAASYIARPSWSLKDKLQEKRNNLNQQIQNENQ